MNLKRYFIYAQEFEGQKLHLVEDFGHDQIANRAICGRTNAKRGSWRLVSPFPMRYACHNCCRIWDAQHTQEDTHHDGE
jgi:hypothetical protein